MLYYPSMYQHIITKIKEFARTLHHQDVQWNSCMLDFESPARMAMTNSIVGIRVRGCLFHMAQATMRRIRRENHTLQLYSRDQNFRLLIQRLTALAFLPVDRVVSTYAVLLASAVRTQGYLFGNDASGRSVVSFFNYYRRQWLQNPQVSINEWNVHDVNGQRTNNKVEGNNYWLNQRLGTHPSFWSFIDKLKLANSIKETELDQLRIGGQRIYSQSSNEVRKNRMISNAKDLFLAGDVDCINFLELIRIALHGHGVVLSLRMISSTKTKLQKVI